MQKLTRGLLAAAAVCAVGMFATVGPATAGASFSISLGNVGFAYTDGYYDQNRHWHRWHNNKERDWYRQNHQDSFFAMSHSRDRDPNRSDWRNGKRDDWHGQGDRH